MALLSGAFARAGIFPRVMDAALLDALSHVGPGSLSESFGETVDMRERLWGEDDGSTFGYGPTLSVSPPFTSLDDRAHGQFLPYYRNEYDLALIRGTARRMRSIDSVLIGALESLSNYVLGESGFAFKAQPAKDMQPPRELVPAVQRIIDRFLDRTDLCGELDREIHVGSREDGESIAILHQDQHGVFLDLIEPDQLTEPGVSADFYDYLAATHGLDCDSFVPCWRFGVLTRADRTSQPIAYHVVSGLGAQDWEVYPASRVVHFKRNVTRNAKRGVSDVFPVLEDCANEIKLRRNTATGAALQASIPWIEEFPAGTTQAGASSLGTSQADFQTTRVKATGTETVNHRRYRPGTIVRTSPGRKFQPGPMGSERADNFIQVAAFMRRSIGVRWSFPEYMISGDASNANYASTLVAESPFVKARQADQQWYGRHFHAMLWKVLRLEYEAGTLDRFGLKWPEIVQLVDVTFDAPEVASRDGLKQAQENQILVSLGAKSIETVQIEAGLDPETERKRGAKPAAPAQPMGLGQPGSQFGQPPAVDQSPSNPKPADSTLKAAVEGALESVETTDEARAILSQLQEAYP